MSATGHVNVVGAGRFLGEEALASLEADPARLQRIDLSQTVLRLGAQARERFGGTVIGVVGDRAGISCADLLARVLALQATVGRTEDRFSGAFSLASGMTRLPASADHWVVELSMLHPAALLRQARAQVLLMADFQRPYAGNGLLESLARRRLLRAMEPAGHVVLCRDVDGFDWLAEAAQARGLSLSTYGSHPAADYRLEEQAGKVAVLRLPGIAESLATRVPGRGWALALLGALAVLAASGGSVPGVQAHIPSVWSDAQGHGRGFRGTP